MVTAKTKRARKARFRLVRRICRNERMGSRHGFERSGIGVLRREEKRDLSGAE